MSTFVEKEQEVAVNISKKYRLLAPLVITSLSTAGLLLALIVVLSLTHDGDQCKSIPNNISQQYLFKHAAVATDSIPCSNIANNIMMVKGGNAVDGAIAGMICTCAVNFHSCGIGGGAFVVIYIKKERKVYAIDLREQAPAAAYSTMFVNNSKAALQGGKSIAVMGLVSGYYEIHQKLGKLPWEILFHQTIDLLNTGFYVTKTIKIAIDYFNTEVNTSDYEELRNIVNKYGRPKQRGDIIKNPKLAQTLLTLSREPHAMKNGSMVNAIVREIQSAGGIITRQDLSEYKVKWRTPVSVSLGNGDTVFTLPPPSSGSLVAFSLNVLDKFTMDSSFMDSCDKKTIFFHRFIETMKFAYGQRSLLGDMDFVNTSQILTSLLSDRYATWIRSQINDDRTHPVNYYRSMYDNKEDHGTSHFSLVSQDGDAVSATSTINYLFGSLVMGSETGILYNDEMDDFSIPNKPNKYNVYPSPHNYIKPGKRPMSSMSPIIVIKKSGDVGLVTGASGGIRIISSTLLVSTLTTLFKQGIKEAIDHPRIHNQLQPDVTNVGKHFPKKLIDTLKKLGHKFKFDKTPGVVVGIQKSRHDPSILECSGDFRKIGQCDGF